MCYDLLQRLILKNKKNLRKTTGNFSGIVFCCCDKFILVLLVNGEMFLCRFLCNVEIPARMLKRLKQMLWLSLTLALFSILCVINYFLSLWILILSGYNFLTFLPALTLVFIALAIAIYAVTTYFSTKSIKKAIKLLERLNIDEFSDVMSKYKHELYQRKRSTSESGNCLICYEYEAKTVTYPCKHKIMCGKCAWTYIGSRMKSQLAVTCILCRTEVERVEGDAVITLSSKDVTSLQEILMKNTSSHKSREKRRKVVKNLFFCRV